MRIFRRKQQPDSLDLQMMDAIANMAIEPDPGILNRSANAIDAILDDARGERLRLEQEITDRQERLRQTNVVIESFEAASRFLVAGADEPLILPVGRKRSRLVAVAAG